MWWYCYVRYCSLQYVVVLLVRYCSLRYMVVVRCALLQSPVRRAPVLLLQRSSVADVAVWVSVRRNTGGGHNCSLPTRSNDVVGMLLQSPGASPSRCERREFSFSLYSSMLLTGEETIQAGPVAQSVKRWTPYGGNIRPGFKSPGFEARRAPDVYRASWRVWLRLVAGHSQSKSAIGTGRARLCAYVKLSTLNSTIDPELRDRKVEDRANATSSA